MTGIALRIFLIVVALAALMLAGCSGESTSVADLMPGADTFPGWTPDGPVMTFERENLYDLVNGQADAFYVYGFEQVAQQSYQNVEGQTLRVLVWQLATPADAYGLFTANRGGESAAVGNDGDADPGRRLAFWQDRYFVQVFARPSLPDAQLRDIADRIAGALPPGGQRPGLVDRLPRAGLVERSELFFHEEISIQNELWLGGENLLGLGAQTDGIVARYDLDGGVARLLMVQYSTPEAAAQGLAALTAGPVSALVAADVRDSLLAAVLGEIDETAAKALIARSLGSE